jgi:hypothetical protein
LHLQEQAGGAGELLPPASSIRKAYPQPAGRETSLRQHTCGNKREVEWLSEEWLFRTHLAVTAGQTLSKPRQCWL